MIAKSTTRLRRFLNYCTFFPCVVVLSCSTGLRTATFNVRNYGAKGDGQTVDTSAIQKAMDACADAGGGTIQLPAGTYLSEPLYLHGNNVTLKVDAGAVLQGTERFDAYRDSTGAVVGLINGDNMTNVSVIGAGVIDGGGAPWWPAVKEAKRTGGLEPRRRPKMVNFKRCHHLTLRDITLQNSPSFHLVPVDCEDVLIDHIIIKAPSDSPNTDAIDPSSCRNVRIVNSTTDVGDDNVAVKAGHPVAGRKFCCEDILVSNCVCLHGHGISIGSETSGGVSNFMVVNCSFNGTTSGIRIKSTRGKGGTVEDVLCRDLTMTNVARPIDISCYYPRIPKEDMTKTMGSRTPAYHGIRIENLTGDCPKSAGLIVGLPESPVRDLTLMNVQLKAATGLWVKNADITLKDVKIEVQSGEPIIAENAKVH